MEYLKILRPLHWIKNLFVFVPIFFAKEIFVMEEFINATLAFIVFCFTASSLYIVNDIVDRREDQKHPQKKLRPIAAGKIAIWEALLISFFLISLSLLIIYFFIPQTFWVILIYIVLNLLYSFYLKHIVIFDILTISSFYLLRVIGGGMATFIPISRWLILCTIFLTLFIIIGKRMAELRQINKRKVLYYYDIYFLGQLLIVSAGLTIIAYGLYSVLGSPSPLAVYSIFFVLVGIFRYLFIIHSSAVSEFPEKIIVSDKVILGSVLSWIVYLYLILYC